MVVGHGPAEMRNDVFDHINVDFNEPIDPATFDSDDVTITGPTGTIDVVAVQQITAATFRASFAPLTVRGTYEAEIGPDIADLNGNLMDQNGDGVAGDALTDACYGSFMFIDADVIFTEPVTIVESDFTYEAQDILIDGTTATINGHHSFNSVHLVNGAMLTHTENSSNVTLK